MTTALLLKIGADASALKGELSKANTAMNGFTNQMKNIGGVIAGAFAAGTVANFVMEVSQLAAEAEGVSSAFSKLPNSTQLINDLTRATEGTVDSLTLMKLSVSALNNQVPIKNLGEILAFVDKTADSTGQSFKDLADTIIKDIGKGSTKGLNDMGLSLETIKKRTDEIGFLPSILEEMRRKSKELGDVTSETADNTDRLSASVTNLKLEWGKFLNEAGGTKATSFLAEFLSRWVQIFRGEKNPADEVRNLTLAMETFNMTNPKGAEFLESYAHLEELAARAGKQLLLLTDQATGVRKVFEKPMPVNFVKDIPTDVEKAIPALKKLSDYGLKPTTIGPVDTSSLMNFSTPSQEAFASLMEWQMAIKNTALTQQIELDKMLAKQMEFDIAQANSAALAGTAAEAIGAALGSVVNGQASLLSSLASVTNKIVQEFARQAIAAAIANAAKAGGPFPFASVVLATTAAALMSRLLGQVGYNGRGGGGGGGGIGSNLERGDALTKIQYGNRVQVAGEFKLSGTQLIAVLRNERNRTNRTGLRSQTSYLI